MAERINACLFDAAGEAEAQFQSPFESVPKLNVLGSFTAWDDFEKCVLENDVRFVGVNLDDGGTGIQVVEQILKVSPSIGIIGVSEKSDPQSIIAAMRAGCNQYVCKPIEPNDLNEAINAVLAAMKVRQAADSTQFSSRRICVIGSSGGAGATTVACDLAVELARLTERTCALVDMNLEFGDIGCVFDCNPKFTMADVCRDDVEVDRLMLANAIHELPCKVALLTRPEHLEDAHAIIPEGVQLMLNVLSEMYPYTLIDLPRSFSFLSAAAVSEADHILIVTQLSVPHIRNATRIYDCLLKMGAVKDNIEIVLNRCKANFERITPDEVEAHFKRPVFAMIPNDYRRVQSSLDLGHPVLSDESFNSPTRAVIHEIAQKITAKSSGSEVAVAAGASSGILGRLWKRGAK